MGEYKQARDTLEQAGQNQSALLIKSVEVGGGFPKDNVV